ncbi:MAG: S41 family peptidase [Defluviitaleaceae bacterium]|nr:S41 family peptidase [Defluviitaleaceae bacterium]
MKNFRYALITFLVVIFFALSACDYYENEHPLAEVNAQFIEDFDYLVDVLRQNYPYIGIAYRRFGADFETNVARGRELLLTELEITSPQHFQSHINRYVINPMRQLGHLSVQTREGLHLILGNIYRGPIDYNGDFMELYDYELTYWSAKFVKIARSDIAQRFYGFIEVDLGYEAGMVFPNNLQTQIINAEAGIAAVRVSQFWHYNIEHDMEIMRDFYAQIDGFNHLILDFRGNPGGFTRYFVQLFMAPNIPYDISVEIYTMFMGGSHNLAWFDADVRDARTFVDIDLQKFYTAEYTLGQFPYLNYNDAAFLTHIVPRPSLVRSTGEILFDGKIWILVDGNSASAVEYAVMYAMAADFATVVGTPTRGVTGGGLVGFFALPNTGMIIRYDFGLFIDSYGRAIDEFGVTPHYLNRQGLNALQTTLELIQEMEER